jgi:hypothetical protein
MHWVFYLGYKSPRNIGTNPPGKIESPILVAGSLCCVLGTPIRSACPLAKWIAGRTLRDAANYIKNLPKSEYNTPEWWLAVQMLIDAAEDRGPMLFAKMGNGYPSGDQSSASSGTPSRKQTAVEAPPVIVSSCHRSIITVTQIEPKSRLACKRRRK